MPPSAYPLNRTIVELKYAKGIVITSLPTALNRTIVELKYRVVGVRHCHGLSQSHHSGIEIVKCPFPATNLPSLNRTIVELKSLKLACELNVAYSLNRTIVELKLYYWRNLFSGIVGLDNFVRGREGAPPNNLLNYGYAILRSITARALTSSGMLPTLGIHHHSRYNAYCLADDIMEPYRPYIDDLVFEMIWNIGTGNINIDKEIKKKLLTIPVLDVVIDGQRSPLMVAMTQTTASLYKCFHGTSRKIAYPEID